VLTCYRIGLLCMGRSPVVLSLQPISRADELQFDSMLNDILARRRFQKYERYTFFTSQTSQPFLFISPYGSGFATIAGTFVNDSVTLLFQSLEAASLKVQVLLHDRIRYPAGRWVKWLALPTIISASTLRILSIVSLISGCAVRNST
jgi:hypothetical protein